MTDNLNSHKSVQDIMSQLESLYKQGKIPKKDESFYLSVNSQYHRKGISEKQLYWMKVLLLGILSETGHKESEPTEQELPSFQGISKLFTLARNKGLRNPSISLLHKESNIPVSIFWSERFGNIGVSLNRKWKFAITGDGTIPPASMKGYREVPEKIQSFLLSFSQNPAGEAKIQGRITGTCCFCGRELSTKESLAMGYGPICADHFGLPWGEVPEGFSCKEEVSLDSPGFMGGFAGFDVTKERN